MFNSDLKQRVAIIEKIICDHEGHLNDNNGRIKALNEKILLLNDQNIKLFESLKEQVHLLQDDIKSLEKLSLEQIPDKWHFSFTNSDGTPNLGFCNKVEKLPSMIEMIKKAGGRDIIIEDQSYLRSNI